MFSKKHSRPQNRINSLIGAGTQVEGDVNFAGGLRIDGEVKGNVRAIGDQPGTLVISEHARIEGDVSVSHLVVNGAITGAVRCGEFVELQPRARVTGDVEYNTMEMHLGAVVQGRLVHQGAAARNSELKLASSN